LDGDGKESGRVGVGTFAISPPLAENPDGPGADRATLRIEGALPGLYALTATIDDGVLVGVGRVEEVVQILPAPENDPPQLELTEPAQDVAVAAGGSFYVRWADSDANDNARISLLLDPVGEVEWLSGDEIVLVASLGEDEDGPGDGIVLGVPPGTEAGLYHVVGVITDGLIDVVTRAPGLVNVTAGTAAREDDPVNDPNDGLEDDPDDDPETPARQIVLARPASDERARLGGQVTMRVDTTNVPDGADLRLHLTNEPFGGNVRVDVTPESLVLNLEHDLPLPVSTDAIPNDLWPREFQLEAEVVIDDEILHTGAPGKVWIRQEVEIIGVEMVDYWCSSHNQGPATDSPSAAILQITWRGGGFGDGEDILNAVRFWLSGDNTIPTSDEDDDQHRMIHDGESEVPTEPGSTIQLTSIGFAQAIGMSGIREWDEEGAPPSIALEYGQYHVMAVVEDEHFGRVVTPAHPHQVVICPWLPDGGPLEGEPDHDSSDPLPEGHDSDPSTVD
jgi:hypothetical protein